MEFKLNSRLANVLGTKGVVSCDQQLAAQVGCNILQNGGNAADAAVAMAAVMAVTEPFSNGLGGDVFCLYFNKDTKSVKELNGSGYSPSALTYDYVISKGYSDDKPIPDNHGLNVNVPAAPAAYCDILTAFGSGKFTLESLWKPAISIAENGFPVTELSANIWQRDGLWKKFDQFGQEFLINGRPPKIGEIIKLPTMAETLKKIAIHGKEGFYESNIAREIVAAVQNAGGVMQLSDLKTPTFIPSDPISCVYKNVRLWETAPNSDGIIALIALNILENFDLKNLGHNSSEYLHLIIEALKLSMADGLAYVADTKPNIDALLSKKYALRRKELINRTRAKEIYYPGDFPSDGDTTYISVIDEYGNACSLITSISFRFGSSIVPKDCGFFLNNRGTYFNLKPDHPNTTGPSKRSFNTIIPAIVTDDATGDLLCSYGIMGGFMQPQAHVQVLLNMLEFNMTPQEALNASRIFVEHSNNTKRSPTIGPILIEDGIPLSVMEELKSKGHEISGPITSWERSVFGRGHVITKGAWWKDSNSNICNDPSVLWSGSDPRSDGCSLAC